MKQARYRFRRNYPYNDTINEDSNENMISEDLSTFTSQTGCINPQKRENFSLNQIKTNKNQNLLRPSFSNKWVKEDKTIKIKRKALHLCQKNSKNLKNGNSIFVSFKKNELKEKNNFFENKSSSQNTCWDSNLWSESSNTPLKQKIETERNVNFKSRNVWFKKKPTHKKSRSDNLMYKKNLMHKISERKKDSVFNIDHKKRKFLKSKNLVEISMNEFVEFKKIKSIRFFIQKILKKKEYFYYSIVAASFKIKALNKIHNIIKKSQSKYFNDFKVRKTQLDKSIISEETIKPKYAFQNLPDLYLDKNNLKNGSKSPLLSRIFFLLSKRFQKHNKYKEYFIDQVQLLIYKHQIEDETVLHMLKNFDSINQKNIPRKSIEIKKRNNSQNLKRRSSYSQKAFIKLPSSQSKQSDLRRVLSKSQKDFEIQEKRFDPEKWSKLEHIMKLYRGDQLFAPIVKYFGMIMIKYQRNFFFKLRNISKIYPFKRLAITIKKKKSKILKSSLYKMLFYKRAYLKLFFFAFILNKIKNKNTGDCFKIMQETKKPTRFKLKSRDDLMYQNAKTDLLSIDVDSSLGRPINKLTDFSSFRLISEGKLNGNTNSDAQLNLMNLLSPQSISNNQKIQK